MFLLESHLDSSVWQKLRALYSLIRWCVINVLVNTIWRPLRGVMTHSFSVFYWSVFKDRHKCQWLRAAAEQLQDSALPCCKVQCWKSKSVYIETSVQTPVRGSGAFCTDCEWEWKFINWFLHLMCIISKARTEEREKRSGWDRQCSSSAFRYLLCAFDFTNFLIVSGNVDNELLQNPNHNMHYKNCSSYQLSYFY